MKLLSLVLLTLILTSSPSYAAFNIGSDVAWDCIYPIEPESYCVCGYCPYCREGYKITWWEPYALIEIVRCPDSSPVWGDECGSSGEGSESSDSGPKIWGKTGDDTEESNKYYIRVYDAFTEIRKEYSSNCFQPEQNFWWDSEWDSGWEYEDASWHLFPEGKYYGNFNYIATSCALDCIQSSLPYGIPNVYFVLEHLTQVIDRGCMGCWGVTYPVTGESSTKTSDVTTSALLAARVSHLLHRITLFQSNYDPNYCLYHPWEWIDRAQYKLQMAYPVKSSPPATCFPVGMIPLVWEQTKKYAGKEEWVYVLWRMRKCCMS